MQMRFQFRAETHQGTGTAKSLGFVFNYFGEKLWAVFQRAFGENRGSLGAI